jgi:hypothetical protein
MSPFRLFTGVADVNFDRAGGLCPNGRSGDLRPGGPGVSGLAATPGVRVVAASADGHRHRDCDHRRHRPDD